MSFAIALLISVTQVFCASASAIPLPVFEAIPPCSEALAPDGSPASRGSFSVVPPVGTLGVKGTFSLWFRPGETLRKNAQPEISLISSDAFEVSVWPRGDAVYVLTNYGPRMTGSAPDGTTSPYRYQSLLTHLRGGRWYHAAWTWDCDDARKNNFYLDGIPQGAPGDYAYKGQVKPSDEARLRIAGGGFTVGGLRVYDRVLSASELLAISHSAGHPGYTSEGVRFTGEKFVPGDVDWEHPVYISTFDDPASLAEWRMEGGMGMQVTNGSMTLENRRSNSDSQSKHLVCWLTREVPADFLLEFTFRPEDRRNGLAIVFFSARGRNGEGIFDPSLSERDGEFEQYHSGDLDCYHTSYWAGARGTANIRKNQGFHLVAVGRDLVSTAPRKMFQTVRVYKRGGKIRVTVDDVLSVSYDDDGRLYGPALSHSGWIGLRQMAHSGKCEYGCVAVYPVKPPHTP